MPQSIHRKNGQIRMTLDVSIGQYDIRIYNSGAEITMDQREKIFDRFYQTDGDEKRQFLAFGLHLSRESSFVCIREPYAY